MQVLFRYETRSDYRRQEELRRDREVRGRERERELSREHGSSHQYSSSHVSSNLVRDTEARAGDRRKRRWVVGRLFLDSPKCFTSKLSAGM